MKTDPGLYLFEYSPDVLRKKTKVLDIFRCGQKMFYENYYRIKSSDDMNKDPFSWNKRISMEQKGMTFDHDFYVVVGKQCRTENVYAGHQHNIFI